MALATQLAFNTSVSSRAANYGNTLNESGTQMTMDGGTTPTVSDEEFAQIVLLIRALGDTLTPDQIVQAQASLDHLTTFTTTGAAWNSLPAAPTQPPPLDDPAQLILDSSLQK